MYVAPLYWNHVSLEVGAVARTAWYFIFFYNLTLYAEIVRSWEHSLEKELSKVQVAGALLTKRDSK